MIKGKAKIQLFDAETGRETYSVSSENMATNAIKNIFNPDISLMMSSQFFTSMCVNSTPFGEKLLSGVMLLDSTLTENEENIIVPAGVNEVGHAGSAYSGTNIRRGSLNINESGAIEGGFRYVWDFASDKANGTINCISLTSRYGGNTGFHSNSDNDECCFLSPVNPSINTGTSGVIPSRGAGCCICSKRNGEYIYGTVSGASLTLSTYKNIPRTAVKMTDAVTYYGADKLSSQTTLTTTFSELPPMSKAFVSDEGKLCFLWKSGTDGVFNFVKVDPASASFDRQSEITLSGAAVDMVYPFAAELGGFLYITLNSTEVGKFTSSGVLVRKYTIPVASAFPSLWNGKIYYIPAGNGIIYIINGEEVETVKRGGGMAAQHVVRIENSVLKPPYIHLANRVDTTANDNSELYIASNYLGTINNLAEPIVKTTNSTMKITYDIVNA